MREIKFRAWNKEEKVFYFDVQNVCRKRIIGDSMCESFEQVCNSWEFEVNQYAELKDINGKEIYEGDILHDFSDELPMIVEWDVTLACFKLCSRIDGCLEFEYKVYEIHLDGLEIIGNIYENRELLKGE